MGKVAGPSLKVAIIEVTGREGRGREGEVDFGGECPPFIPPWQAAFPGCGSEAVGSACSQLQVV